MDLMLRRAWGAALQLAQRHAGTVTPKALAWRHRMSAVTLVAGRCKSRCPVEFSQEDLRKRLTPIQYHVTQEQGTERAFTGEFNYLKKDGIYTCVVCSTPLFRSDKKFDSGSGWPSFFDVIDKECITLTEDCSHAMRRIEATCSQCGSHLGHLFEDGPLPTGLRYCINSASLDFQAPSGPSGKSAGTS